MTDAITKAEIKRLEHFFIQESARVEIEIRQSTPHKGDIVVRHVITKPAFDRIKPVYLYTVIALGFATLQMEAENE